MVTSAQPRPHHSSRPEPATPSGARSRGHRHRSRRLAGLGLGLAVVALLAGCSSAPERYDYATVRDCMGETGAQIVEGTQKTSAGASYGTGGVFHARHTDSEGMDVVFVQNPDELAHILDYARTSGDTGDYHLVNKNVVALYYPPGPSTLRQEIDSCLS